MSPEEKGEALRALVDGLLEKPVEYGVDDCSMICVQWLVDATGKEVDFPAYSSREEAEAIIEEAGGLVNVWQPIAWQAGLEETDRPEVGDIGIVNTSVGEVGAIFLYGLTFIWRAENGVRVIGARPYVLRREGPEIVRVPIIVRAWKIP